MAKNSSDTTNKAPNRPKQIFSARDSLGFSVDLSSLPPPVDDAAAVGVEAPSADCNSSAARSSGRIGGDGAVVILPLLLSESCGVELEWED